MRWRGRRRSSNIDDRRHLRPASRMAGSAGLLRLLPLVFRFLGVKGTLLLLAVVVAYALFTGDLGGLIGGRSLQGPGAVSTQPLQESPQEQERAEFVSVVLADTEDTWHPLFQEKGMTYREPKLVLFRGAVESACGTGRSAMGPFYCPGDEHVYIDLGFYDELQTRFRAPGDFAQAYVIAHEVGHHVQTLLGISQKVHAARRGLSQSEGNELSVRQELQADCLAGVWAHHARRVRQLLEEGDVEEALAAASAIGDDAIQRGTRGTINPDSFTHGTSEQRVRWFRRGLDVGTLDCCDTFSLSDDDL